MTAPPEIGLGRGRVVTFYASETWLAASPAVASVATQLARWAQRVLVVDWDLGGTGLEQLFPGLAVDGERTGLLDLAEARRSGTDLDWRDCVLEAAVSAEGPAVRLITAGRRDGRHTQRLRRIDWRALFTGADFGAYLERIRTEWLQEHDFVLVNSPAGRSDATTICAVYLPDVLVALYAANPNSVEDVADVARRARLARSGLPYDRGHLVVLPVPAWDEGSGAFVTSGDGLSVISKQLSGLYRDVLPREVGIEEALEVLRVPARPDLGEPGPDEGEGTPDLERAVASYAVVARLVGSGLRWDVSVPPNGGSAPSETADFFISYSDADRQWATWAAWILEHAGHRVLMWAWDFVPSPSVVQRMAQGIRQATWTIALLSPAYIGSVYGRTEWQAALASDPRWLEGRLLTVRIAPCQPEGPLASVVAADLVGVDDETSAARLLLTAASRALGRPAGDQLELPSLAPVESSGRPAFPRRMDAAGYGDEALPGRGADVAARHRAVAGIVAWVSARSRATPRHVQRLVPAGVVASLAAAALTPLSPDADDGAGAAARLGTAAARLARVMADVSARLRDDTAAPVTREDLRDALADELLRRLGQADAATMRWDLTTMLRTIGGVNAALRAAFDSDGPAVQERLALSLAELGGAHVEFAGLRDDVFAALDALQRDFTEFVLSGRNRAERSRPALREVTLLRQRLLASTGVTEPAADPDAPPPEEPGESPYRGLAPFQAEDARWFHGRAALTAALVNRLAERLAGPSVVLVAGASGAGKSSLLNAGLLPGIRTGMLGVRGSEAWPHLVMHPGASPVTTLAQRIGDLVEVDAEVVEAQLRADPAAFAATVRRSAGSQEGGRLVLVVDQFEELFTLCRERAERHDFIRALRAIASPLPQAGTAPAAVVLGLRADRYADCTGHPELMALLDGGQVVVGPMTADELREAIAKPAETAGLTLESGLVEVILRDLDPRLAGGYDPGRLPLLSHALLATWQRRRGRVLDLAGYQEAGGIDGAITNTADQLYQNLGPGERKMMRRVLLRLVSVTDSAAEDARARVRREELLAPGSQDERRAVEDTLDRLVEVRLVTASEEHLEITHEALLRAWPRLRGWIDEDRDWLPLRRHLATAAADWERAGRDPTELYGTTRLAQVHEKVDSAWRAELGPLETAFLAASEEQVARRWRAEHRRVRSGRALAALLAALLIATAFLAVAALQQRSAADTQRNLAESRQMVAEATSLRTTDPGRAAQLSVHAFRLAQTAETRSSLLGTRAPEYRELAASAMVTGVAVSPAGGRLAAAGQGGGIDLWDLVSGAYATLGAGPGASPVYAVAFSPDGGAVAGAGQDGSVSLWDVASGRRMAVLSGHAGRVNSVAFGPDGHLVATAGADGTVRLWDARAYVPVSVLVRPGGPSSTIEGVTFSPDGRTIASAGGDTTIVLWDVASGAASAVLAGAAQPVRGVTFSPDGQTLAGVDDDGSVSLWDVARRAVAATIPDTTIGPIRAVAFAPRGGALAVGSEGGVVQLWRVGPQVLAPLTSLQGSLARIRSLAFGPDGTLAAVEGSSRIGLWDLGQSSYLTDRAAAGQAPASVVLGPRDSGLAATAGVDGTIRVWRARDGSPLWTIPPADSGAAAPGDRSRPLAMGRAPDGRTLLAAPSGTSTVAVWDVAAHQRIAVLGARGDLQAVTAIAFRPDGQEVAIASSGPRVRLWDVRSQSVVGEIANAYAAVDGLAFSPGGDMLATANDDGTIDLSNVEHRTLIALLPGHLGPAEAVAFSPDGTTVAAGGRDGTVTLWSVSSHQQLGGSLEGHVVAVVGVAFNRDGRTLAAAGLDRTVLLWSLPDRSQVATLGGQSDVTGVAFSPDGSTLLGAGAGGGLISWDTNPDRVTAWICARHPC
jgi:WD40 repeat protein